MTPPPDMAALARAAVAANGRTAHAKALAALARAARRAGQFPRVVAALADAGGAGPRTAAELLARCPGPLPAELIGVARRLVASQLPTSPRLAVAGLLLDALPDETKAVRPVVAALTAGLSKRRAAERLQALQRYVAGCRTLDALAEAADAAAILQCPRCRVRLPRQGLIRHLWARHGLLFDHGKSVEPRAALDPVVTAAVAGDAVAVDQAFLSTATYYPDARPRQVLQALAARGIADPAAVDVLTAAAGDADCGLCPVCLNPVADPIGRVPPPATWAAGRVTADGFASIVTDPPRGRVVVLTRPGFDDEVIEAAGRRQPPRRLGVFCGLPPLVLGVVGAAVAPASVMSPLIPALIGAALGGAGYAIGVGLRSPLPRPDHEALRLAWETLTPGIGRSPAAVRFLTRLCRTSVGVGDPVGRSPRVYELVEHAAVLADRGPAARVLLAAARVLQAADGAAMGRERATAYAALFAPVWRGELPLGYAEAAAELVLTDGLLVPGDPARLAAIVAGQAFAAGLTPSDLTTQARFAPWVGRLLGPADRLAPLRAVWRAQRTAGWPPAGAATVIIDFARDDPDASRTLLLAHPDLLADLRLPGGDGLGPVGLTAGGVAVGGATVADPAAVIAVTPASTGRWTVQFGPHRFSTRRPVPAAAVAALRAWLKFRADRLVTPADRPAPLLPRAVGLLAALAVPCPLCQAVAVQRAGRVGTPWEVSGPEPSLRVE